MSPPGDTPPPNPEEIDPDAGVGGSIRAASARSATSSPTSGPAGTSRLARSP